MDMASALEQLGAREELLTEAERTQLDREGYVLLPGVMSRAQIDAMNERLLQLVEEEGEAAGIEQNQEKGVERLADLVNKGDVFDICYTEPRVLSAVYGVIGDFKLHALGARNAPPGEGHQVLHVDWPRGRNPEPVPPGDYRMVNSVWLLDDFTEDNGPTRLVPKTHATGQVPKHVLADADAPHPDEIKVVAKAGTVLVFNGHIWHGGTRNQSNHLRRSMHSTFIIRSVPQLVNQKERLRPQTGERLTEAARYILDV